jgi:hypothetical protein
LRAILDPQRTTDALGICPKRSSRADADRQTPRGEYRGTLANEKIAVRYFRHSGPAYGDHLFFTNFAPKAGSVSSTRGDATPL